MTGSDDLFGRGAGAGRRTIRSQGFVSGITRISATSMAGASVGAAARKSLIVWPGRILTVKLTGGPRSMCP